VATEDRRCFEEDLIMAGNALAQIGAITALNIKNMTERLASSIVALVGIAGVVTVLIGVLSISEGFRSVLDRSGAEDVAIVLREGSTDEMGSGMSQTQTRIIADAPQVARDAQGAIVSPELYLVVDVPARSTGTDANVPLRGVSPGAAKLRQDFRIVEGRNFVPGTFEVIVGSGAARQFAGLDVGRTIRWGTTEWLVAGIFEDRGSVAQSEIWTDASVMQGAYNRGTTFQSVRVKLSSADALQSFKDTLTTDPRLNARVFTEKQYYEEQSLAMTTLINSIGVAIALLMGLGAIFAALNTMYSAVSARTREIATLRALGFGSGPVVISVLAEALLIGLVGGAIGMLISYVAFDGVRASTMNFATFSQITFAFTVTPTLLTQALIYALILGLIGGSLPCLRAARLPITTGLREL
jgi:putative ABC transport system permease protein